MKINFKEVRTLQRKLFQNMCTPLEHRFPVVWILLKKLQMKGH